MTTLLTVLLTLLVAAPVAAGLIWYCAARAYRAGRRDERREGERFRRWFGDDAAEYDDASDLRW